MTEGNKSYDAQTRLYQYCCLLPLLAKYNGFVETCKLPFLSLIYKSFLFAFALEWDRLYVRLNADLLISDIQHRGCSCTIALY